MKNTKQCKTCKWYHTAGLAKFSKWCTKYSGTVNTKIGHCKLNNGYESKK